MEEKLIKSKQRVKDLAEVYTPEWLVNDMLNLVINEDHNSLKGNWLEPSCGNGNFIVKIIERKLEVLSLEESINTTFGVDICPENVAECIQRIIDIFECEHLRELLNKRIIVGDFLKGVQFND